MSGDAYFLPGLAQELVHYIARTANGTQNFENRVYGKGLTDSNGRFSFQLRAIQLSSVPR